MMNKKAVEYSFSFIIGATLTVILLFLASGIISNVYANYRANVEVCPGVCQERCRLLSGEVQFSSPCLHPEDGLQSGKVCCVAGDHIRTDPSGEDDEDSNGASTSSGATTGGTASPSIEVRRGVSNDKISASQPQRLEVGREYTYFIWGFGIESGRCRIEMIDDADNRVPSGHSLRWAQEAFCVDNDMNSNAQQRDSRQNRRHVLSNTFNPGAGDTGRYVLQVTLLDSSNVEVQSIRMRFDVVD